MKFNIQTTLAVIMFSYDSQQIENISITTSTGQFLQCISIYFALRQENDLNDSMLYTVINLSFT